MREAMVTARHLNERDMLFYCIAVRECTHPPSIQQSTLEKKQLLNACNAKYLGVSSLPRPADLPVPESNRLPPSAKTFTLLLNATPLVLSNQISHLAPHVTVQQW